MEIHDEDGNVWHKEEARKKRLNKGVNSAHMCIPFQCELYCMRNLEGRDLMEGDVTYIMCLRQAQLDAISGKSHLTIKGHQQEVIPNVWRCESIRKTPSYEPRGPFPLDDPIGMGLIVDMLLKSLMVTGEIKDYVQFGILQKLRSTFARNYSSSPQDVGKGSSFAQGTGRVCLNLCPSQSDWI